ncbi:hypothetical protein L7F22_017267 [Adiantum nelumboides]|nr:hypothetical protein [Adiantum nelumboides]
MSPTQSMSACETVGEDVPKVEDLKELLKKNDELHCLTAIQHLCKYAKENPPFIFGWENIHLFVAQICNIAPSVQPPFSLPNPLSVRSFKAALLDHIKGPNNTSHPVGTTAIPCTQAQSIICGVRAERLAHDPWFRLSQMWVAVPRLQDCMYQDQGPIL